MKHREYSVTGAVSKTGTLMIASMAQMNDFFSQWKGAKVVGSFQVYESGSSEAIKGLYYNKFVPDFRKARWDNGERATKAETEKWMRELCPVCMEESVDEKTGKYTARLREINELSNQEMVWLLEHLKQIAAEEFCLFIDDIVI